MFLWIEACGSFKKIPRNDDFEAFEMYKEIFDNASNFELENSYSLGGGGGMDGMGCTDLHFKSKSGGDIYLYIDGGFPIPESADLNLECMDFSHDFIVDICKAFGEYYQTEFEYYRLTVSADYKGKGFVYVELYKSERYFEILNENM